MFSGNGSGFIIGITIVIIVFALIHFSRSKPAPKEGFKDGPARLACRSETVVFSNPPGLFCALEALETGLELQVATKDKPKYLLKYENIHTFKFADNNSISHDNIRDVLPQNIPDTILLSYKTNDGILHEMKFRQTKEDKIINQKSMLINSIFIFVNERIQQNT